MKERIIVVSEPNHNLSTTLAILRSSGATVDVITPADAKERGITLNTSESQSAIMYEMFKAKYEPTPTIREPKNYITGKQRKRKY